MRFKIRHEVFLGIYFRFRSHLKLRRHFEFQHFDFWLFTRKMEYIYIIIILFECFAAEVYDMSC